MKFTIDYDIMQKIRHAKEGFTAGECYLEILKKSWYCHPMNICNIIYDSNNIITNQDVAKSLSFLFLIAGLYSSMYLISKSISKSSKPEIMHEASCDLNKLANDLYGLEVRTSTELLLESEVIKTNYEIIYKDDKKKIPSKLKQKKYIKIPLTNGYEETILQEHVFGDKDYEISVKSPTKEPLFNRRLAKAGI